MAVVETVPRQKTIVKVWPMAKQLYIRYRFELDKILKAYMVYTLTAHTHLRLYRLVMSNMGVLFGMANGFVGYLLYGLRTRV